jgi:hypothetical protein
MSNKDTMTFINILLIIVISLGISILLYTHLTFIKEGFETVTQDKVDLLIDAVIYINLDHRTDRNREILDEIQKIGIPKEKIFRLSAVKRKWGALGASLSHKAVMEFIIQKGWKRTLILEDDAGFEINDRWNKGAKEINKLISSSGLKNTDSTWDVIFLGGFVRDTNGPIKTEYETLWRTKNTSCAHAYIVRGDYVPKILEHIDVSIQMMVKYPPNQNHFNLDNAWSQLMVEDRWYITLPTLAYQRESYSDIEGKNANSEQPLRGNVVKAWAQGSLLSN